MINLTNLEQSMVKTIVSPSDKLFEELGRNNYDYKDLLSELIDNCIAAKRDHVQLDVAMDVYTDANNKPFRFVIRDNANGISEEKLGNAVSPAGFQSTDSLNEHGLGMKQAVAALGKLEYLATKTENEAKGRLIKKFCFGEIVNYYVDFPQDAGTEIAIIDLKAIVNANPASITSTIAPYLGARYRRFLRPDNKSLNVCINLRRVDKPEDVKYSKVIHEIKPVYFHPSTRSNEPVILKHKIGNSAWSAELTFGYAPTKDEEYAELGLQKPLNYDPYNVSQEKQGLDVIFQDRVILFHQWSEQKIVAAKHPTWNHIRGEIDLKHGFATAITKNSIIHDHNFTQCIDEIRDILTGKKAGPKGKVTNYLLSKRYPGDIPEIMLRHRLANWLENNAIHKKTTVRPEYVIEGIEGYIDILADGEAWELKVDQASAYDVYQLFMYMDVGKIKKGFLVAESFSPGATVAMDYVFSSHQKEIVLAPRSDFPINGDFSDSERAEYFG